jgi:hypothetical protein
MASLFTLVEYNRHKTSYAQKACNSELNKLLLLRLNLLLAAEVCYDPLKSAQVSNLMIKLINDLEHKIEF